jgi:hypothetical protein
MEDAVVVATFPLHVVATPVAYLAEDFDRDPLSTATTLPVFLPLYAVGDALFTGVSAVDLAVSPVHAAAGVGTRRLGYYDFRDFPPVLDRDAARRLGWSATGAAQVVAPVGAVYLDWRGRAGGSWQYRDATTDSAIRFR